MFFFYFLLLLLFFRILLHGTAVPLGGSHFDDFCWSTKTIRLHEIASLLDTNVALIGQQVRPAFGKNSVSGRGIVQTDISVRIHCAFVTSFCGKKAATAATILVVVLSPPNCTTSILADV